MGLIVTSWVQVYVSMERIAGLLGEPDLPALAKATAFGAVSSGCSFGAAAIANGLFGKGAHAVNTLDFMLASTNLIVELGLMMLTPFGWEFLAAEILGGLVLILIMAPLVRLTLPENVFAQARRRLAEEVREEGDGDDPVCGMAGSDAHTLEWTDGDVLLGRVPRDLRAAARRPGRNGWYRLGNRYRKEGSRSGRT